MDWGMAGLGLYSSNLSGELQVAEEGIGRIGWRVFAANPSYRGPGAATKHPTLTEVARFQLQGSVPGRKGRRAGKGRGMGMRAKGIQGTIAGLS